MKTVGIPAHRCSSTSAPLRIVGLYADLPAQFLAMRVFRDVARQCSPVCDIAAAWWCFETLGIADAQETAARTARDADMVWCSSNACEPLPDSVKLWMADWAAQQPKAEHALVALLRCPAGYDLGLSPTRTYLRRLAEETELDFFEQRFDCGCHRSDGLHRPSSNPLALQEGAYGFPCQQFRHWGLNE